MLPEKSKKVIADTPSKEFPYMWVELNRNEQSAFFPDAESAIDDANDNYHNFHPSMKGREVLIVKIEDILSCEDKKPTSSDPDPYPFNMRDI